MNKTQLSEKGQILILMVLLIIGLLGFTALAIDGGMIFADRRFTQSAADAASLAGAGAAAVIVQENEIGPVSWSCNSQALKNSVSAAVSAAIASADANDYIVANDNSLGAPGHDHGVKVTCDDAGEYIDVEVMLSRETSTSFVHLFTGGVMRNTVHSKTRVKPLVKAGNGASIVGMGTECDKQVGGGVHFDSGSLVTVLTGGGVYSNDCVYVKNNADVKITNGNVTCHVGTQCDAENINLTGGTKVLDPGYHPMTGQELFDLDTLNDRCSQLPNYGSSDGGGGTIEPGRYTSWDFKDPVHLNPGLYCVSGTVSMNAGGEIDGTGITIYYTGTDLTINGHANSELSAPNLNGVEPDNFAIEDVLLYVPKDIHADIKINGNAGNIFSGTLWAPGSYYKITGTSDITNPTEMDVSLIGQTVWISGTSYINLKYDEKKDAGWPSYIQVEE
jgi:hypothetical protein